MLNWQSKINFDCEKANQDFDVYNFKDNEVMFDKPIYLGFTNLELAKMFLYKTYYDTLQTVFDPNLKKNLQLHYIDCDSFVLSNKTDDLIKDLVKMQEENALY